MNDIYVEKSLNNFLLYLAQHKPVFIYNKFMENYDTCYAYLQKKPSSDTYLGNDGRSLMTLFTEALVHHFSQLSKDDRQSFLKDVLDTGLDILTQNEDFSFIYEEDISKQAEMAFNNLAIESHLALYTYVHKPESLDALRLDSPEPTDLTFNLMKHEVEKLFHMEQSFEDCPFVKKGVKKLQKYIFDDMISHISKDIVKDYSIGQIIVETFENINGCVSSVPAVNKEPILNYFKEPYGHVFTNLAYSNWIINTMGSYQLKKEYTAIAERAVEETCRAAIISRILLDVFSVKRDDIINKIDMTALCIKPTQDTYQPSSINQFVVKIDTKILATSCIWSAVLALIRKQMHMYQLDSIYLSKHRYAIENDETSLELEKTKKLVTKLEKENVSLNDTIRNKNNRIAELQRDKPTASHKNDDSIELKRLVRRQESELERMKKMLEEEQEKNRILNEKYNRLKNKTDDSLDLCNYNKKYVFICEHQTTARKLMDKFPNSISSTSYDITPNNASTIDAVICITPEISHGEYERVKNQCIVYKIPFINCNSINIDRVASVIATELA